MGWIKNWFGTKYYQILYQNRNEQEAQDFLDRLTRFLPINKHKLVLDIGCGHGRHSYYLAKKGFHVLGTDILDTNIELAKSKYQHPFLTFKCHDMREPFGISNVGLALNLFTSFGYFENEDENLQVLKNIHEVLENKGIFVLDFFNAAKVAKDLVPSEEIMIDEVKFEIKRCIKSGFVLKEIKVYDKGEQFEFMEKVQLLYLADFERYFSETGFRIVNTFGSYDLENFKESNADRLIMVLHKE